MGEAYVSSSVHYPDQYYDLHPDVSLNFQLNRMYGWVDEEQMLAEIRKAAPAIHDYADWRRTFSALSDAALAQDRTLAGAFYLRLAEFFMFADDPAKKAARERFVNLVLGVYGLSRRDRTLIAFGSGALPAYRFTARDPKGTLVLFGGYDSYIEEWLSMFTLLRDVGYDVIAFEGPGQGGALEEYGLKFTSAWHRPVAAVLDHFGLSDVALIGLSLGGCLVFRAAAFEPRVRRIVAWDALTDLMACELRAMAPAGPRRAAFRLLTHAPVFLDSAVRRSMKRSPVADWGMKQGMHTFGVTSPHALFDAMRSFTTTDVSARITQDVLVLAGTEDNLVPRDQVVDQLHLLPNAASVTVRVFTRADQAQNHCQVGNFGLALRYILEWLAATPARR